MFCRGSMFRCHNMFVCVFLKGLNTLQNLKELNLADNDIEKIGGFLELSVFSLPSLIEIQ